MNFGHTRLFCGELTKGTELLTSIVIEFSQQQKQGGLLLYTPRAEARGEKESQVGAQKRYSSS